MWRERGRSVRGKEREERGWEIEGKERKCGKKRISKEVEEFEWINKKEEEEDKITDLRHKGGKRKERSEKEEEERKEVE